MGLLIKINELVHKVFPDNRPTVEMDNNVLRVVRKGKILDEINLDEVNEVKYGKEDAGELGIEYWWDFITKEKTYSISSNYRYHYVFMDYFNNHGGLDNGIINEVSDSVKFQTKTCWTRKA